MIVAAPVAPLLAGVLWAASERHAAVRATGRATRGISAADGAAAGRMCAGESHAPTSAVGACVGVVLYQMRRRNDA